MNLSSANFAAPIEANALIDAVSWRISRSQIAAFLATVQLILFSAHWSIYRTWTFFEGPPARPAPVQGALSFFSLSFVAATLLSHRYNNVVVRLYYKIAAIWLGFLNSFVVGGCFSWIAYLLFSAIAFPVNRAALGAIGLGLALILAIYGFLTAHRLRVQRITLKIPNLPRAWRGRLAAQVSDTHLGHVHGQSFLKHIVRLLQRVGPDIVFITGDLFDGSKVDPNELIEPWRDLKPPLGTYFVTGNHEEFGDPKEYLDAVRQVGVRILDNQQETVDGMQIIGLRYRDSVSRGRLQAILERKVRRESAAILLTHAPYGVSLAAQAGVSLQLSGHTHGGQIFPFTYFTRKVFQEYTHGLARFQELMIYTSSGAGTWGPPMRLGAPPEIVLFEFA